MFRDALGRSFTFDRPPRRVVSLVPSLTETLFELGAGDAVVAITDFCLFPEGIERPRVGGTKNPDIDAIHNLSPDLVYMNLEENLERHAREIEKFAPVFLTEPKSVADVNALMLILGSIHGCDERAAAFVRDIRTELQEMPRDVFTFACPIWKKPWMWCGGDTYVSNLVGTAGGLNILQERSRYPSIDLGSVVMLRPNVIFLPDEPYLFKDEDADEMRSAMSARVIGPFPGHLFTWHGARTLQGLRFLRKQLES